MRNYSQVAPSFWVGTTGRQLRTKGIGPMLSALYLITCPSANMIGLFYLPLVTMAHETGMSMEAVRDALQDLAEVGFAFYDENEETFWVPEMAKFQIGERLSPTDNQCKGVQTAVKRMMKSAFYPAFWERYHTDFHLPDPEPPLPPVAAIKPHQGLYDGASRPHPSPGGGTSEPLPSQDQYQGHLQIQENEPTQDQLLGGRLDVGLVGAGLVPTNLGVTPNGEQPGLVNPLAEPAEDWVDFGEKDEMGGPVVPVQEARGSICASDGPGGTLEPEVPHGSVPPEIQEVFDTWDRACCDGTPYAKIQENQKQGLVPMVVKCLRDPEWKTKFTRFVEQMKHVPFYSGRVPSTVPGKDAFVPFFRWMVMKGPMFINEHLARLEDELKRIQHSSKQGGIPAGIPGSTGRTHLRTASDTAYLQGLDAQAEQGFPGKASPNPLVAKKQKLMQKEQTT